METCRKTWHVPRSTTALASRSASRNRSELGKMCTKPPLARVKSHDCGIAGYIDDHAAGFSEPAPLAFLRALLIRIASSGVSRLVPSAALTRGGKRLVQRVRHPRCGRPLSARRGRFPGTACDHELRQGAQAPTTLAYETSERVRCLHRFAKATRL